jgi:hypothetical protein
MKIMFFIAYTETKYIKDAEHITLCHNGTVVISHIDGHESQMLKTEYEFFGISP